MTIQGRAPLWAKLTATVFGVGLVRRGPGTVASAITVVVWWEFTRWLPLAAQPMAATGLAVLAVAIGIPAATQMSRATGLKDPQFVVIDEVAGQLITLILVPVSWQSLLAGFILFRSFDMLKPPPLRYLEKLPEGAGVVMDDVGAGLYAFGVMQILLHLRWSGRWLAR
jgi:phosphatidylglycerophosphatase A